jgi:hypothetical protein
MISEKLDVKERSEDVETIAILQKVSNVKKDNPDPETGAKDALTDYELTCKVLDVPIGSRGTVILYALLEGAGLSDLVPDEEKKVKSTNMEEIVCGSKIPRTKVARLKEVLGDFGDSGAAAYRALLKKNLVVKGIINEDGTPVVK